MLLWLSCNAQHHGGGQVSPSCDAEVDGKCRPEENFAPPAPPRPAKTEPVTDVLVVEVDHGVAALDVSSIPADATSSAPPAPASAAGANSPPGEDPPAASVAVDTTAASTAVEYKTTTPAPPATQRSGGGDNHRGRKSQATQQLAASAALNKLLQTARGLQHSSEAEMTTTSTTDNE